jgi:hypothetical protein
LTAHRCAILKAETPGNTIVDITKKDYIRQVLDAYRRTPGTTGAVRRNDRLLAATLYDRGVSVTVVENALVLAASRRIFRSPDAVPLQPIRSLHYLLPVIDEVLQLPISQDYFRYLQLHIDRAPQKNTTS